MTNPSDLNDQQRELHAALDACQADLDAVINSRPPNASVLAVIYRERARVWGALSDAYQAAGAHPHVHRAMLSACLVDEAKADEWASFACTAGAQ